MAREFNFIPAGPGLNKTISATTTSASQTLAGRNSLEAPDVMIANEGPNTAFIRFGTSAQTAVTSDFPLLPGSSVVLKKTDATIFAAITSAGSATVYVYPGAGA